MPLTGQQLLANQGRAVRQTPVNYSGRPTTAPQQQAGAQLATQRPVAGARPAPGPIPRPAVPRPQPQQVADVRFNRAAAPAPAQPMRQVQQPNRGVPGPAPQGMATMKDYLGQMQGGAQQTQQKPAYNGMMGAQRQQMSLQQALAGQAMAPKELGPAAPTQAYDPNAGRERADQSLMGPKANLGDTLAQWYKDWDQQQRDNNAGDSNEQATQSGSAATDEPVSTNPQRDAENERYGVRRDGSGGRDPVENTRQNTPIALTGDLFNPENGNPLVGALGDILSGLSGQMSREDMANLEKYFGESLGGYRDIMQNSRDMMDPAKRDQWESAARDDLNATVNADKMQNLRMNAAAAGRGGFMSSNADTGIYGNAAQALASGERGIAQDRFSRDLSATQAGNAGLGAGAGALQDLIGEGFTSNKEVLAYLLTGMEKGADIGQLLADMVGGKWTA